MVSFIKACTCSPANHRLTILIGSRGPGVLDDFTASYGYRFSDAAGYQWPTTSAMQPTNKL